MRFVVLFCLFFPSAAHAHDWYDADCCSSADCRPVPCEELTERNRSVWYRKFEFFGQSVRPSKDSDCHVCISNLGKPDLNAVPHCVYVLNGS